MNPRISKIGIGIVLTLLLVTILPVSGTPSFSLSPTIAEAAEDNDTRGTPTAITNTGTTSTTDKSGTQGDQCKSGAIACHFITAIKWLITFIGQVIISLLSRLLAASGLLLNYAIHYGVVEFSTRVAQITIIDSVWATFRDVSNLIFIFGILLIAGSLILQLEQYGSKKLLGMIVVMALFVNFSLFITKFTIDVSNIIALQFNNAIVVKGGGGNAVAMQEGPLGTVKMGVANVFAGSLKLQGFWKDISSSTASDAGFFQLFATLILSVIFILTAVFVFTAAAVMLILRLIVLIFLMILSPLAFAAMALPMTQGLGKQWWEALFKNAFYAPVFMMLLWFTAQLAANEKFRGLFGGDANFGAFATAVGESGSEQTVGIVFYFLVIILSLVACIVIASKLSTFGASFSMKVGGLAAFALPAFIGRRTIGMGFNALGKGEAVRNWARGKNAQGEDIEKGKGGLDTLALKTLARGVLRTSKAVGKSSFDARSAYGMEGVKDTLGGFGVTLGTESGKGGYAAIEKQRKEREKEYEKYTGATPAEKEKAARKEVNFEEIKAVQKTSAELRDSQIATATENRKNEEERGKSDEKLAAAELDRIKSKHDSDIRVAQEEVAAARENVDDVLRMYDRGSPEHVDAETSLAFARASANTVRTERAAELNLATQDFNRAQEEIRTRVTAVQQRTAETIRVAEADHAPIQKKYEHKKEAAEKAGAKVKEREDGKYEKAEREQLHDMLNKILKETKKDDHH